MILKFAIQDFIDDRTWKNLSPKTIDGYLRTLKEFHDFCVQREIIDVSDIKPAIIKSYLLHCQKVQKNKPASLNHKLHNLKIFFNYLQEIEVFDEKHNPTKKINYVKEDQKIEVFSDYHIQQMLNYYKRLKTRDKSFWAYRDYCIIITLLGTGIRLGELCGLRWNDIDFQNDIITVFGKKRIQTSLPMGEKLKKELTEYKVFVEQYFKEPSEFVFTNKNNVPLTTNAVQNIFKRLKKVMNFKDVRLSAHTFRHTYATRLVKNGADAYTVQKLLRHSSINMTLRYVHMFSDTLKDKNNKFNPLEKLDI